MTISIDKIDGRGLSNSARREHLPRRLSNVVLATEGIPDSTRRSASVIKVSGRVRSDALKRRLAFSLTVIQ